MKKTMLCLLLCVAMVFSSICQAEGMIAQEGFDLRSVKWGMTEADVEAVEGEPDYISKSDEDGNYDIFYYDEWMGIDIIVFYYFNSEGLLYEVYYSWENDYKDVEQYKSDYNRIAIVLEDEYGKPSYQHGSFEDYIYTDFSNSRTIAEIWGDKFTGNNGRERYSISVSFESKGNKNDEDIETQDNNVSTINESGEFESKILKYFQNSDFDIEYSEIDRAVYAIFMLLELGEECPQYVAAIVDSISQCEVLLRMMPQSKFPDEIDVFYQYEDGYISSYIEDGIIHWFVCTGICDNWVDYYKHTNEIDGTLVMKYDFSQRSLEEALAEIGDVFDFE